MSRLACWWLRKVVSNEFIPSLVHFMVFRTSVTAHLNRKEARHYRRGL
jgi:hypothetical protein